MSNVDGQISTTDHYQNVQDIFPEKSSNNSEEDDTSNVVANAQSTTEQRQVPLVRVVVDKDLLQRQDTDQTSNTFVVLHEEDERRLPEENKSIFEVKHRIHLNSLGNERPNQQRLGSLSDSELDDKNPNQNKSVAFHRNAFLPDLVKRNPNRENCKENRPGEIALGGTQQVSHSVKENKKRKKARKLYDYNDLAYLEHSRRARRRKQSEVDIEVGLRLSRYVQRPYEGNVDKYSKKLQAKKLLDSKSQVLKRLAPTSSNETSPLSSSSEQVDLCPRPRSRLDLCSRSRLADYNEEEVRSYFRGQRGARRRSLSSSPPRVKTKVGFAPNFQLSVSHNASPVISPSSSGTSSPALARYRKSTFSTILNSTGNQKNSKVLKESTTFPDIHLTNPNILEKDHLAVEEQSLPQSLPEEVSISPLKPFTSTSPHCQVRNSKKEQHNMDNKQLRTEAKAIPRPPSSPGCLRKHVLLNSSIPCGSPTFQRAMEDLHQPQKQEKAVEKRPRSPVIARSNSAQRRRIRVQTVGGRRRVFQRSPSTPSTKPGLVHRVSFRDKSEETDDKCEEAIHEMRDKLTTLSTNDDVLPASPGKSILRNRRRSIDDLDVGTKKGLAMYLRSKQQR